MANNYSRMKPYVDFISEKNNEHSLEKLRPKPEIPIPQHVHQGNKWVDVKKRLEQLNTSEDVRNALIDPEMLNSEEIYPYKIENLIGTVKVPVGLAGPLRINGLHAQGDFYIPMATLEPTLLASYSRGAQCITKSGGCTTLLIDEGVRRTPGFQFNNMIEASHFLNWLIENYELLKIEAEKTSRFGRLIDLNINMCGNQVFLDFEYKTGDAVGQNMVTIATQAVIDFIDKNCPVVPVFFTIEANMAGDKKATIQSFQSVRGRKVTAEIIVPADVSIQMLNATPEQIVNYYRMSVFGGILSGLIGIQGHVANALTALYIACGQDTACVAESSVSLLNMDVNNDGSLYAALTLPNIMVGTIGWATDLPSQNACLEIMGLNGDGKANKFAEICAGICLAGELSIAAALGVGEFTSAHARLARGVSHTKKN